MYSGTENLYKFMLICGLALISLALVYPLQKQQVLEIENNLYKKDSTILNEQIKLLEFKVDKVFESRPFLKKEIDSLSSLKVFDQNLIEQKKKVYFNQVKSLREERNNLKIKQIASEFQSKKIQIINGHISKYRNYTKLMTISGLILTFIGLVKWWIRSKLYDKKLRNS